MSRKESQIRMAFNAFMLQLKKNEGELRVATDSCVANSLRLSPDEVSNENMRRAVHWAIIKGLVIRRRNHEPRDHYDNPVTFQLTRAGFDFLAKMQEAAAAR